jgi:ribosomal protein S18 acetylase RimI-like enzyme
VPELRIRPFDPDAASDRAAVLDICVKTGDAGGDATALHADPRALTDRYATPYLELEPGWAWVATLAAGSDDGIGGDDDRDDTGDGAHHRAPVVGYLLGAPDTTAFAARFAGWPSSLTPAERTAHAAAMLLPERHDYPAHLHIDLLPRAQGRGAGRALVQTLVDHLAARNVPGLHLVADPRNHGALAFYPRVGFTELRRTTDAVVFGRRLGLTTPGVEPG